MDASIQKVGTPIPNSYSTNSPIQQRQLKEAYWYLEHGNFENALEIYSQLADQNVPEAQFYLGVMYKEGDGVETNYSKALTLFRKAADQQFLMANVELGKMYRPRKEFFQAYEHFHKAAEKKIPEALYYLGTMYRDGEYVQKNPSMAIHYFKQAAELDFPAACNDLGVIFLEHKFYSLTFPLCKKAADLGSEQGWNNLGYLYTNGYGAEKNHSKAIECFTRACELNTKAAWENLEITLKNSNGDIEEYEQLKEYYAPPHQLRKPETRFQWGKVYNYYKDAVLTKKDPRAFYNLGMMHLEGRGTEKNAMTGLAYLEQASGLGDQSAKQRLEQMIKEGYAGYSAQDIFGFYVEAANQQEAVVLNSSIATRKSDAETWALHRLGMFFLTDEVVKQDVAHAIECFDVAEWAGNNDAKVQFEKLINDPSLHGDFQIFACHYLERAKQKEPWALYRVGMLYSIGCNVEKNLELALSFLEEAAQLGVEEAPSVIYSIGLDLIKQDNFAQGWSYLDRAAELGNADAKNLVKERRVVLMSVQSTERADIDFGTPGKIDDTVGNPFYLTNFAFDKNSDGLPIQSNKLSPKEKTGKAFQLNAFIEQLTPDFLKSTSKQSREL